MEEGRLVQEAIVNHLYDGDKLGTSVTFAPTLDSFQLLVGISAADLISFKLAYIVYAMSLSVATLLRLGTTVTGLGEVRVSARLKTDSFIDF